MKSVVNSLTFKLSLCYVLMYLFININRNISLHIRVTSSGTFLMMSKYINIKYINKHDAGADSDYHNVRTCEP